MALNPRRVAVALLAFVAVVFGVNTALGRVRAQWDLTAEGSATLSSETRRVLDAIDRRIEITAFFPRDALGRVEAATLLARYRDENRRITYRILDPELAPGEVQRLGVQEVGSAAVSDVGDPDQIEIAQYTIEIDITSAIARLVRDVQGDVCFAKGHGERSIKSTDPEGMSQVVEILRANGYKVRTLDLISSPEVPRSCSAVVLAAPTTRIRKEVRGAITDYGRNAGKIMLLADPEADVDLTPISRRWGITFDDGVVIEGDPSSHLPDDLTAPVVTRYAGGSPVVRGLGPTFFPRTMAVDGRGSDDPGLTVTEIASTSELAYLDRDDLGDFDPKIDRKGPVGIGAAADDTEVLDPTSDRARIKRTRIIAWGDVDFATNAFVNDGANARLWLQGIDWLTQPEDLVTAVPKFPAARELDLTEARSRYMLFLMAGVIPGLFVIAGGLVWAVRRGR